MNAHFSSKVDLLSIATAVPNGCFSTDEMLNALAEKTSPDVIKTIRQLGVESRYSVVEDYPNYLACKVKRELISSTTGLSNQAIANCLQSTPFKCEDIGLLIAITNTANRPLPCLAFEVISESETLLPHDINIINMQNQGCSVLLKAIDIARCYLHAHPKKFVLVVAAEAHTAYIEKKERSIYHGFKELIKMGGDVRATDELRATEDLIETFLFGDGAVALLLGLNKPMSKLSIDLITHATNLEKNDEELLSMNEGGILQPEYAHYPAYHMSKHVPQRGAFYAKYCLNELTKKNVKSTNNANFYCIHTGSKKILDGVCHMLNTEAHDQKAAVSYDILTQYGNLSSCSIGFMLAEHVKKNTKGTGIVLSFGVGFSASAGIINI